MKNLPKKKTKVVCTIGPASDAQEVLEQMIRNGMNIARLNFAHGDTAGHERIIQNIRAAAARAEEQVTIMGDLPGPKIAHRPVSRGTAGIGEWSIFYPANGRYPGR